MPTHPPLPHFFYPSSSASPLPPLHLCLTSSTHPPLHPFPQLFLLGSHELSIHDAAFRALLLAVLEIALASRHASSLSAARSALVQLVTVAFRRMESSSQAVSVAPVAVKDPLAGIQALLDKGPDDAQGVPGFLQQMKSDLSWFGGHELKASALALENIRSAFRGDWAEEGNSAEERKGEGRVEERGGEAESRRGEVSSSGNEGGARREGAEEGPSSVEDRGEESDTGAAEGRRRGEGEIEARSASDTADLTPERDGPEPRPRGLASPSPSESRRGDGERSPFWKDARSLFRGLCQLASRGAEAGGSLDAMAVRGKVLALELLALVLENSRDALMGDEVFLEDIKQLLLLSLVRGCLCSLARRGLGPRTTSALLSLLLSLVGVCAQHTRHDWRGGFVEP